MEAFYQAHKQFILSTIFLAFGLMVFGYSVLYNDRKANYRDLLVVLNKVTQENKQLQEQVTRVNASRKEEKKEPDNEGIQSMPVFLRRINSIANHNDVIIESLEPLDSRLNKFAIQFKSDYETFVRFAGEFESLNVVINDLEVRPFDSTVIPPVHVINFSITPRNDAEELTGERLNKLRTDIAARNKRNPFQRFAFHAEVPRQVPLIDLTWINKLTGIGKRKGQSYATIDRLDYDIGDRLGQKVITAIEIDRVLLEEETAQGTRRYVLKFRKKLQ